MVHYISSAHPLLFYYYYHSTVYAPIVQATGLIYVQWTSLKWAMITVIMRKK